MYWEPPKDLDSGPIKEYSVYLQTRTKNPPTTTGITDPKSQQPSLSASELLHFTQIYCGPDSNCVATSEVLSQAYIDMSSKPAILFRIAAKNEKGYGPATQVRWLQQGKTSFFSLLTVYFYIKFIQCLSNQMLRTDRLMILLRDRQNEPTSKL